MHAKISNRLGPGSLHRAVPALFVMILAVTGTHGFAHAGAKSAVLELFTSQGCSSCPPADQLMRQFADDERILTLSFPVDYWDYLGWRDTLARHENTERQQSYAARRGDRSVYTPQVIVNGRDHEVGSDKPAILGAVDRQVRTFGSLPVDVDLGTAGGRVSVSLKGGAAAADTAPARVWLVLYNAEETVAIGRGENRGATVSYTNVVRAMVPVGRWTGEPVTLYIPPQKTRVNAPYDNCVVLVQRDENGLPGPIVGVSDPMPLTNP